MASIMLSGMLLMSLAIWLYAAAIALWRVRSLILVRDSHAAWVHQLPEVLTHRALRGAA
jgi:heme exporter protein C